MKYLLFLPLLILIACNRKTTTVVTAPNNSKVEIPTEKPTIETPESPSIETIEALPYSILALRKTPCYGKCPVFEARFMSDGRVTWLGKKNTERLGHYEAFATPDQLENLQQRIKNSQFQTFQPTYPTNTDKMIMDLPQTITKVQIDGQTIQVTNNYDAPIALQELEKFVQVELDKLVWRKIQ